MADNENYFLDHPEVQNHFKKVFPIIIEESDRGAVLLAASQLELILEKALHSIAPEGISNNKLQAIFEFSGPLGTFSAKINMAYYFRIIGIDAHSSLNVLRKLRNDVAHECKEFSLANHSEQLKNYYELGPGIPVTLHNWAIRELLRNKIHTCMELRDPTTQDDVKMFETPLEVAKHIQENPHLIDIIEQQLPKWKLGFGTALICGLVFHGASKLLEKLESNKKCV